MTDRRDPEIHRLVMDWPDDAVAEIERLRKQCIAMREAVNAYSSRFWADIDHDAMKRCINERDDLRQKIAKIEDQRSLLLSTNYDLRKERDRRQDDRSAGQSLLKEARRFIVPSQDSGCPPGECDECDMHRLACRIDAFLAGGQAMKRPRTVEDWIWTAVWLAAALGVVYLLTGWP